MNRKQTINEDCYFVSLLQQIKSAERYLKRLEFHLAKVRNRERERDRETKERERL